MGSLAAIAAVLAAASIPGIWRVGPWAESEVANRAVAAVSPEVDTAPAAVEAEPEPEVAPESAVSVAPAPPEVIAALESGSLRELDGLLFHNAGVDPFAWRPDPASCRDLEHAVLVDRAVQRGWYCSEEQVVSHFLLTSSDLQPDPGDYAVYAKDIQAWSWDFGPPSTMTHFVAFTRGKFEGARIAFHSVPKYSDGSWAQPLESVGTMEHFGDSAGCIRLLPEDAEAVWDFLEIGGLVRVVS